MMSFIKRLATKTAQKQISQLEKELADLVAVVESKDRTIGILESEIEGMANVIARDRARVQAEMATHARSKAEAEGKDNYDNQSYITGVG